MADKDDASINNGGFFGLKTIGIFKKTTPSFSPGF
jgi:hypothetical protein